MEQELDSFDRKKREISNHFLQMDPTPTELFEDEMPEELEDYDFDEPDTGVSTMSADTAILQDIKLPLKTGSPAFKIIASKVYILYPSMFQDPNIFGRFSIPQSINMEGKGDLSIIKEQNMESTTFPTMDPFIDPSMAPPSQATHPSNSFQQQQYNQQQYQNQLIQDQNLQHQGERQTIQQNNPSRRMMIHPEGDQRHMHQYRRQQPIPIPPAPTEIVEPNPQQSEKDIAKERSIQSHMRGQIVVQNQDVNEYNTQKRY